MNKIKLLMSITMLSGLVLLPQITYADTTVVESTATFDLIAPSSGTLKITNADNLEFESKELSSNTLVSKTINDTSITIQELSGNAPGWTLSSALSDFKDGDKTLTGAQIFYPSIKPTTNAAEGTAAANSAPTSIDSDTAFEGDLKGTIITAGGSNTPIVTADKGNGYGQWTMTYADDNKVQLSVPQGQLTGNYQATITYTLTDSPTV